jgi:lipoprotein-anchoring transpeptidase ErfK/SrfK
MTRGELRGVDPSVGRLIAMALVTGALGGAVGAQEAPLTVEAVNEAQFAPVPADTVSATILKAQVLLDRARFSVGAIDAKNNENLQRALAAFQSDNGLEATGQLDEPTWSKLTATSSAPVLINYEVRALDVKGPFSGNIPSEWEQMAKLARLAYTGPREALAERFHMHEELLNALNPNASFNDVGKAIVVANVRADTELAEGSGNGAQTAKSGGGEPRVTRIEVDKTERTVRAFDRLGHLVAFYPASVGSADKPSPHGTFKIQRVYFNPAYRYDPKFAFPEVKTQKKFSINPGPNNPVGSVWIDLNAPSYGIHGTPEPENVARTGSHGCVRLTNWDVIALAALVDRGTVVHLKE